ncbi:hypothetical protein EGW08_001673 [Elysia chlorotica]|uniref:Saposin B-type domain-containing protein n=1 Tax=Elysia chlorotica TaxID=188477 RepID=A0A433U9P6_ELYCH|nr:hypothetical protein EGW08_001673 [Elysia chlorotica]
MGPFRAVVLCAVVAMALGTDVSQSTVQQFNVKDNKLCEDCRAFMTDMDSMFFGPGMEENIMERVEKMCTRLPAKVGKFCDEVFTDWIENAFKFADKIASPDVVCNALPFCREDEELLAEPAQGNLEDGPVCSLCEEMVGQVTSLITDRRLQSDFEDFMQTFMCAYLPTPLNGMCKDEVNTILGIFFGVFDSQLPARRELLEKVLSQAKLAHKMAQKYSFLLRHFIDQDWTPVLDSAVKVISEQEPKVSEGNGPMCDMCEGLLKDISALATSADFKKDIEGFTEGLTCAFLPTPFNGICKDEIDRLTDIFFDFFRTQLKTIAGDVGESAQCTLCKEVLGQFESVLLNTELKTDVERISEGIMCTFMPGDLGKLCKSEVDRFTDLIFDLLALSMNASNICQMTGICREANQLSQGLTDFLAPGVPHLAGKLLQSPVGGNVGESAQCTLCKTAITQFDNIMLFSGLKADIEYITKATMCGLLPGKVGQVNATTICHMIGICWGPDQVQHQGFSQHVIPTMQGLVKALKPVVPLMKMMEEDHETPIMEHISSFIIEKYPHNATTICHMIGICWGPDQVQHQGFSQHVIPTMQGLVKALKPVVPLMKMMEEDHETPIMEHISSFLMEKYPHVQGEEGSVNDAACNVCRRVMDLFKTLMDDGQFKGDVEEMAIEMLCPIFPKNFQGLCKMEIHQVISTFFDMLDTDMDVSLMCDFLGMCQDDDQSHYTLQKMMASVTARLQKMAEAALPTLQRLQAIKTEQGDCALCEILMDQVFNFLKNDNSRSAVVSLGLQYCDMLASPLDAQCKMYVGENTARFMDEIVGGLTPKLVCQSVTMCDVKHKAKAATPQTSQIHPTGLLTILAATQEMKIDQPKPKIEEPALKVKREHRAPWCDICEEVSSTVNAFIGSQELLRVAVSIGDSICMLMPTGLKYPCDTFVRTFFDEFLGDVSSFMTPDFVCGVIGVCYIEFTPMNYSKSEFLHPTFHRVP